ncbi:2654_t:CDS:2 [Dentiscutata erythropus]|uniref:2654_t:CDS:1 n=1 Tax=Dentiscutata erythropus TaxID=1348616 RepID=A0A9N8ZIN6_9GLOM|nr:2654_t:CDS:2 [Dentiscutata erythropus]
MSLKFITEAANLLLQTTLSANVGFTEISINKENFIFTYKEEELLKLVERLELLKKQQREQEYALQIQQQISLSTFAEPTDEIELKKRIDEKKQILLDLRAKNLVKDKSIECIETGKVILTNIFPEGSQLSPQALYPFKILDMINERDRLVVEILKSHQELLKAQTELIELQQAVIKRHRDNRQLMKQINDMRTSISDDSGSQDTKMIQRTKRELADARAKREVVRNVLQGLILESGIDWAEDEHLLNLLLMIGEELYFNKKWDIYYYCDLKLFVGIECRQVWLIVSEADEPICISIAEMSLFVEYLSNARSICVGCVDHG